MATITATNPAILPHLRSFALVITNWGLIWTVGAFSNHFGPILGGGLPFSDSTKS